MSKDSQNMPPFSLFSLSPPSFLAWSITEFFPKRWPMSSSNQYFTAKFFLFCLFSSSVCLPGGFPGSSDGKESTWNLGDLGLFPGLGRSLGGGHGKPLQFSCLENPLGQRSLVPYSPWGRKELDTTERLPFHFTSRLLGFSFPNQGLNPGSWQWKCCVLTTRSPGNSLPIFFFLKVAWVYVVLKTTVAHSDPSDVPPIPWPLLFQAEWNLHPTYFLLFTIFLPLLVCIHLGHSSWHWGDTFSLNTGVNSRKTVCVLHTFPSALCCCCY